MTSSSKEAVVMHHEFQTARQAEILARAARRRLAREAEEAAKAAKEARTATAPPAADSGPGPDSRTRYARTA
ncbi:hypothetical protein ACFWZT_04970 [Streptomyces alboflavus]|uniref:hypothetical protein n=1 Tax=Streptomyces alboflavus TaxID=67267 RepID=UPI0036768376